MGACPPENRVSLSYPPSFDSTRRGRGAGALDTSACVVQSQSGKVQAARVPFSFAGHGLSLQRPAGGVFHEAWPLVNRLGGAWRAFAHARAAHDGRLADKIEKEGSVPKPVGDP